MTVEWQMLAILVFLLIFVAVAIALAVKYVAKPFIREQQRTTEAKAAMQRELEIAAATQRDLVPHKFPPFPDHPEITIHACLHPALEVGGDLYDYFINHDKLYFCIGDVSGKGAPASLFMAATHYLFRSVANEHHSTTDAVTMMNRNLCTDNSNCTFVTFFYGCLDLKSGTLEYCNAGHNLPIMYHAAEGTTAFLRDESDGMPLGVFDEAEYTEATLQMRDGDTLFLYTDGVTEAMNKDNQELGDAATLECISANAKQDPQTIIQSMRQRISQHAGDYTQSDDITMLCVKYKK